MENRRNKTTFERGKFKNKINNALCANPDIMKLLVGDTSGMSGAQKIKEFKKHVKSHLFIDEVVTETGSYIFYDISMPFIKHTTKMCKIILYAICHKDVLEDNDFDGFYGNRADILSEMVEDCLLNNPSLARDFGIGELNLEEVAPFNNSSHFYGVCMTFDVPNFR